MNNTKFLYSFLVTFALFHLGAAFYPHLYQLCCQDSYSPWRGHNYYHHFRHEFSYNWPESTYRRPHYFFKPPLSYYYYDPCRSYRQNCHITQFHKCCYDCCGKLICTVDYHYVFTTTLKTTSKTVEETTILPTTTEIIEVTTIPTAENTTPEEITIITTEEITTVEKTTPDVTTQTTEEITENITPEVTTQTTEEITTNTIPVATTIKDEITTIITGPGSGDGPSGNGSSGDDSGDGPSGDYSGEGPSGDYSGEGPSGNGNNDNELPEIQRRHLIWDELDNDDFDFSDDFNMNDNHIVVKFI